MGIADADGDVARLQPKFFGDDLRDHGLDAAPDVLHGRERFHRTVLVDANFAAGIHAVDAIPDGLGYAHAVLHRARIAARLAPLLRPPELLRSDAPLLPSLGTGIVLVHKLKNVYAKFFRERVHRLLQAEDTLRMAGGAHCGSRTGVGEDVVLFRDQVGAFIKVLRRAGGSRAGTDAGTAVADPLYRLQLAVLAGARLHIHVSVRTIAGSPLLLFAIAEEPHGSACLFGEVRRDSAGVTGSELRAEAAAHVLGKHADLRFRQIEDFRQFVAHAHCALGGRVDGQTVGLPVGYEAVCLQRGVSLHLGAVLSLNDGRGRRESFLDITLGSGAAAAVIRTADIAFLRNICGPASPSRGALFHGGSGEDQRSIGLTRLMALDHERQRCILHFHQAGGFERSRWSRCRNRCDGLAGVTHNRISGGNLLGLVLEFGLSQNVLQDVHGFHSGVLLGGGRVDGNNLRVRNRRVDQASVEHSGQVDVAGVFCGAGGLERPIVAGHAFANHPQFGIQR